MSLRTLFAAALAALAAAVAPAHADSPHLVSTEWLEKNLSNPKVRVIEVSVNPGVYERGHIPGAVNVRWHSDLVDRVERDIAKPEHFQALLRQSGVSQDSITVLYGDNNNWFAAWGPGYSISMASTT